MDVQMLKLMGKLNATTIDKDWIEKIRDQFLRYECLNELLKNDIKILEHEIKDNSKLETF